MEGDAGLEPVLAHGVQQRRLEGPEALPADLLAAPVQLDTVLVTLVTACRVVLESPVVGDERAHVAVVAANLLVGENGRCLHPHQQRPASPRRSRTSPTSPDRARPFASSWTTASPHEPHEAGA